jgi:crotonobetainyl-CoA:carnitine CoA-transferase CaiB-like acyl-CoA transferase
MAYAAMSGESVPPMPARVSAWGIYHQFDVAKGERVFIGVTSDKQWLRFCAAFGREDWLEDDRIATNNGRVAQQPWLLPAIQEMVGQMPKADVLARCEEANLPFSPIARPEDLFEDAQLNEGGSLLQTTLPNGRITKLPKIAIRLGEEAFDIRNDPPEIGQQTTELLVELGYSAEKIQQLRKEEIIR